MIAALAALAALGAVGPVSSLWSTDPVGGPEGQPTYRNAVAAWRPADAWASPRRALAALLAIEQALGRERRDRWGPRRIDLDLLAWDADGAAVAPDRAARSGLPRPDLPHPRAFERPFVLVPWSEVAPGWRDPRSGATVADAAAAAGWGGVRPVAPPEGRRWAAAVAALVAANAGALGDATGPR
jgi:2-amino-4-hydroxy-6-hydroxymethyldihydropteridine diphosphokinase